MMTFGPLEGISFNSPPQWNKEISIPSHPFLNDALVTFLANTTSEINFTKYF
jgi:hypothetical protein